MYYNDVLQKPFARAELTGNSKHVGIRGRVTFYDGGSGLIINLKVNDLPYTLSECGGSFLGFHLHEGSQCSGNDSDQFANAGKHYNPENCIHISHAGDFPPIINCGGFAYCEFFTNRLSKDEVIGKTVVIHGNFDDFTTQPSGGSGDKIACGVVKPMQP